MMISALAMSCNEDSDDAYEEYVISNSTAITAFNLNADDSVLANLDSVHFTIDISKRIIYNADSLPRGTKITGLTINASFPTTAACKIVQEAGTVRPDSIYDYTTTDSIDFTGNVKLRITAADGTEVDYQVKVNVHQLESDSLYWNQMARRDLPNVSGTLNAQRTVQCGDKLYTLLNCSNGYILSTTDNPATGDWQQIDAQFGMVPNVNTFAATNDALFILDENGALYTSADGSAWSSCGIIWHNIIGGYTDRVLGVGTDNGAYTLDEYPRLDGYTPTALPDKFPISGNSQLSVYDNTWNKQPQMFTVGGIDKDGRFHGDCWGYDGKKWALLRTDVLPPMADVAVVKYVSYEGGSIISDATEHRTWIAMGGRTSKGDINDVVYISRHQGLYWNPGDDLLQLPDYIGNFYGAQTFCFSSTLTRSASLWTAMPSKQLPVWASIVKPVATRAAQITNEWDCPYLYLFGGINSNGTVNNSIWRGVINRLTFAPIL